MMVVLKELDAVTEMCLSTVGARKSKGFPEWGWSASGRVPGINWVKRWEGLLCGEGGA